MRLCIASLRYLESWLWKIGHIATEKIKLSFDMILIHVRSISKHPVFIGCFPSETNFFKAFDQCLEYNALSIFTFRAILFVELQDNKRRV